MEATEDEALRKPPLADGCADGDGADVGVLALLNDGAALSTRVDVSERGVHVDRPAELLVRRQGCRSCTSRSALQAR